MKLYKITYRESDGSSSVSLTIGNSKEDAEQRFSMFAFMCRGFRIFETKEISEIDGYKIIVQK